MKFAVIFHRISSYGRINVNGLGGCLDEAELQPSSLGIHFLAINETKLDKKVLKELSESRGYKQFHLEYNMQRRGVVAYVRNSIKAKLRDDMPFILLSF